MTDEVNILKSKLERRDVVIEDLRKELEKEVKKELEILRCYLSC